MSFSFFNRKNDAVQVKPFKHRKPFDLRQEEVMGIRIRFPNKIPIVVERYYKEKTLPLLDKSKFLVPHELQMSKFIAIIRNRMHISQTQSFYLIINNQTLAAMSKTMVEIYKEHHEKDGFLYITYASQEMFGQSN